MAGFLIPNDHQRDAKADADNSQQSANLIFRPNIKQIAPLASRATVRPDHQDRRQIGGVRISLG